MKITLTKATFYFNDPINLTPQSRTIVVDLASLDDAVVRKLKLGVVTGVVEITEGSDEFEARATALTAKAKEELKEEVVVEVKEEVTPEPTKEVETVEEVEVKEEVKAEEVETPKRKTTITKKTTAKKA